MKRAAILAILLSFLCPFAARTEVDVFFNSQSPLDEVIMESFSPAAEKARKEGNGTLDIAIFSFTRKEIGDDLLNFARANPDVKIRLLADLSQLTREEYSVVPDMEDIVSGKEEKYRRVAERRNRYIKDKDVRETRVKKEMARISKEFGGKPLDNLEIRYLYYPSWSWNEKTKKPDYDHFHPKAAILHHKAVVVNGDTLVTGSYNWSWYAENKNLENLMVFRGPEEKHVVDGFLAELETMWNNPEMAKSGEECRRLREARFEEIRAEHPEEAKESEKGKE